MGELDLSIFSSICNAVAEMVKWLCYFLFGIIFVRYSHVECQINIIGPMSKVRKILISQPNPPSGHHNPYADMSKQYGVETDFFQLIRLEGLDASTFRKQHINPLDYTAVLFGSTLAVDHYFHLCERLRIQVPESMHYYCISDAVGNYLQHYIQYRKRRVFPAADHDYMSLLPTMKRRPQEKYLMVVSDNYNEALIQQFKEHGITVQPAVMYHTLPVEWPKEKPFDYDMLVLFTPQAIMSIKHNFPDWEQGDTKIACLGAKTAEAVVEAGYHVDIQAPSPLFPSITAAIEDYLEKNNG